MRLTRRLLLGLSRWRLLFPLTSELKGYSRDDLGRDSVAGLVVGMVTVPQAVAYAYLAGLPPQAGLYACLLPMLIYALMGSSRHLVVGPVAVAALLVAAAIAEHSANYDNAHWLIASVLCVQVGLLLFALRASGMGGLVNLLSHPVITGFVNAAALLIIISQLPAMTGIQVDQSGSPLLQLAHLLDSIGQVNWLALVIGTAALAFLLGSRFMIARVLTLIGLAQQDHPLTKTGPLWAALLGIGIVAHFGLGSAIDTVGLVPSGLPSLTWPILDAGLWLDLLPSAAVITVVTYIESYSIGATLAAKERYQLRPNQELIALGAANLGAGLSGAYPVAGSFSRSGVNYAAGARTPVSSIVCAGVIIVTLLFATQAFVNLPNAVLAAIVMVSVLNLVDLQTWRRNWRVFRQDCWTEWGTALGVIILGVEMGLMLGVALSIAFFLRTSSKPVITQIGRLGDSQQFRSAKRYAVTLHPQILALRVDENIYFANAGQIEERIVGRALRRGSTTDVLLACGSVNLIDSTGLTMLKRVSQTLADAGIRFSLSEIKGPLLQQLQPTDLASSISGQIFFSNDEAMQTLMGNAGPEQP